MNFCSRAAIASDGPLAGTGVRAETYVFAPVPKRLWGASEINSAWASEEELAAVREARSGGVITRLYNPVVPEAAVLVYGGLASAALPTLLSMLSRRWAVDEGDAPRVAVCTQGTRDRCCAKWGFAAYREAARLFAEGLSKFEALECSHLGGDRFAATGIFFPGGNMHGHVDPADLQALADAEAAGMIRPTTYRGNVFESEMAQVVRAGLARDGVSTESRAPLTLQDAGGDTVRVRTADGREHLVRTRSVETRFFASCAAMDRGRTARGRRLVYAGLETPAG